MIETGYLFVAAFLPEDISIVFQKSNPHFNMRIVFEQGFSGGLFLISINGRIAENFVTTWKLLIYASHLSKPQKQPPGSVL